MAQISRRVKLYLSCLGSLGLFLLVLQAHAQTPFNKRDSLRTDGFSVGADLMWPLITAFQANHKRWEIMGDYAYDRHFLVAELGQQLGRTTPAERSLHDVNGAYLRLGYQYNLFTNGDDALLVGGRYAFSTYQQTISEVTLPSTYWGASSLDKPVNRTLAGGWLEGTLGIRVRLFWQAYLTLMGRVNVRGFRDDFGVARPHLVPGYGDPSQGLTYNLNYYLTFKIPTRTRSWVPVVKKKAS